jgi:ABC-type branched-subunit amino acid transport system ATPase component/ABC-type branched-subunit amino acid transport system permease subunit
VLNVPALTRTRAATIAVLVALAALWFLLRPADLAILAVGLGYATAAIGVDVATGYAGQPNFGQAAFMAVGAYSAAIFQTRIGLSFMLAFLLAIILCSLVGLVLGVAAARLEHLGFGITTFAFAFVVAAFLSGNTLTGLTGGPNGLAVPPASLFGLNLTDPSPLYVVAFVALSGCALLAHNFVGSRSGRATLTVKQNHRVAAVMGISTVATKLRAFAMSAAFGGAGGIIIAQGAGYITPDSFPPAVSITVFAMAAFGGVGTITGPIIGAFFFWLLPSYVPALSAYQVVLVATLFLLVLVLAPRGVVGEIADRLGGQVAQATRARWTSAVSILSRGRARVPATAADAPDNAGVTSHGFPIPRMTSHHTRDRGDMVELPQVSGRTPGRPPILVARDITVSFGGVTAVASLSLEIADGSCHGLVGPNGAGKTTLLNVLSGTVRPQAGEISLDGARIDQSSPQRRRRQGVARTFQHPSLVGDLSALDNVKVGLYPVARWSAWLDLIGFGVTNNKERRVGWLAAEALRDVGFPVTRMHLRAMELSHGEQKIVDLARAIVGRPRVLLLDEPTAGLTVDEMNRFATVLDRQRRQRGTTLVIVSHHMRFLKGLAQTITVLDSGQVLAEGTFRQVSADRRVVTAFLGEDDEQS